MKKNLRRVLTFILAGAILVPNSAIAAELSVGQEEENLPISAEETEEENLPTSAEETEEENLPISAEETEEENLPIIDDETDEPDLPITDQEIEETVELLYDDRYSFQEEYPDYVIADITDTSVSSYMVYGGQVTSIPDTVISKMSDSYTIRASGVGSSTVTLKNVNNPEDVIEIAVEVEPAKLSLIFMAGQSNNEGYSTDDGSTATSRLAQSIACEDGTVYSTYLPSAVDWAKEITNLSFSDVARATNADRFVAGSLTGRRSIYGNYLEYPLNALTESGDGKTGSDSAIAYQWNQLTGDKVWIVNASWSTSRISTWAPGGSCYSRIKSAFNLAAQTYAAEILSGHFVQGNTVMFWQQGENDAEMSASDYLSYFQKMYLGFKEDLNYSASWGDAEVSVVLDAIGMISVRAYSNTPMTAGDIVMTGPRLAQYGIAMSSEYPDVFMVSNENEQWISDSGVQNYFAERYSGGVIDYPTQAHAAVTAPTTVAEIHGDVHYTQLAHNENGLNAAYGLYAALEDIDQPSQVQFLDRTAQALDSESYQILQGAENAVVPVVYPVYTAKKVSIDVNGTSVDFNPLTATATGLGDGRTVITASSNMTGELLASQNLFSGKNIVFKPGYTGFYNYYGTIYYLVNGKTSTQNLLVQDRTGVVSDGYYYYMVLNGKVDESLNGLVRYNNNWWYFDNGRVATEFSGVAYNSYGHWYVENGRVNFNYNGWAKNTSGTYFYFVNGKVNYNLNGLVKIGQSWWLMENGRVKNTTTVEKNSSGWWYVKNGKVDFTYTGIAQNSLGWWRIVNGKVDFSCNSVEKNEYGWWYIRGGKVDFTYTGAAKNSLGWWRIVNGKVDFSCNTIEKNEYGWWYFQDGKIDFTYTGIGHNSLGDWYCKNGKVDFTYNGYYRTFEGGKLLQYSVTNGKATKVPQLSDLFTNY